VRFTAAFARTQRSQSPRAQPPAPFVILLAGRASASSFNRPAGHSNANGPRVYDPQQRETPGKLGIIQPTSAWHASLWIKPTCQKVRSGEAHAYGAASVAAGHRPALLSLVAKRRRKLARHASVWYRPQNTFCPERTTEKIPFVKKNRGGDSLSPQPPLPANLQPGTCNFEPSAPFATLLAGRASASSFGRKFFERKRTAGL